VGGLLLGGGIVLVAVGIKKMIDRPLPVANGAPLRLRVENQLGYKHAKYIQSFEFVASFEKLAQGKGGHWEDQGYELCAFRVLRGEMVLS
jgi:DMSO/TMAO reductase YedYZ molybdopterin-dependent catalytic subunit